MTRTTRCAGSRYSVPRTGTPKPSDFRDARLPVSSFHIIWQDHRILPRTRDGTSLAGPIERAGGVWERPNRYGSVLGVGLKRGVRCGGPVGACMTVEGPILARGSKKGRF